MVVEICGRAFHLEKRSELLSAHKQTPGIEASKQRAPAFLSSAVGPSLVARDITLNTRCPHYLPEFEMKDSKEDIEVKLKSSDTGVEYHEKASASDCELTKDCYISVWPRQKYAFAINLGASFEFDGASDLCIGFRINDGSMRYGKTVKARTRQHRYDEAHLYADATLIADEASGTESKVLPFEFMATDGGRSSIFNT